MSTADSGLSGGYHARRHIQLTREQAIGVSGDRHPGPAPSTSHHGNNPEKLATIAINTFHNAVRGLPPANKDTPDGDGSLSIIRARLQRAGTSAFTITRTFRSGRQQLQPRRAVGIKCEKERRRQPAVTADQRRSSGFVQGQHRKGRRLLIPLL
jgi:hypothetical protein